MRTPVRYRDPVKYGTEECVHGVPGGDADTCPLCRIRERARKNGWIVEDENWVDVRRRAAGDET